MSGDSAHATAGQRWVSPDVPLTIAARESCPQLPPPTAVMQRTLPLPLSLQATRGQTEADLWEDSQAACRRSLAAEKSATRCLGLGLLPGPASSSHVPTQAPPTQPGSGTHRGLWSPGAVPVRAEGAAEGPEGLAVLSVLRDGGLDDLGRQHRPQRCHGEPPTPHPAHGSAPAGGGEARGLAHSSQAFAGPAGAQCRAGSPGCSRPWVLSVGVRPGSHFHLISEFLSLPPRDLPKCLEATVSNS